MAEEKYEPRDIGAWFRQWMPWTLLFRGFWVALDHKKLLLAAAGILVMSLGWYVESAVFAWSREKPQFTKYDNAANYNELSEGEERPLRNWDDFKRARNSYNLFFRAASRDPEVQDAGDLATSFMEFKEIEKELAAGKKTFAIGERVIEVKSKPYGELCTLPWFEDRGPNPFLLITGHRDAAGTSHYVPWQRGEFADWAVRTEVPVLLEPLYKLLKPVFFLFNPSATWKDQFYFLMIILWTIATWAIFGGAITRIAAVEVSLRNEKIGLSEALRFTISRWRSYLFASFAPLIGLAVITLFLILFGLINLIPIVAEFSSGLLWFLVLGLGLAMAVLAIGLVGWPMIQATLSTEGSDSFDALSRSYSYVLQRPWSYLWYALVALGYGAIVVFFVGFMGSLMVYLGKWGVSQTPFAQAANRDPSYMFVYAPTSFGWRELLLQNSPVVGNSHEVTQTAVESYIKSNEFHRWNFIGATFVSFWLYLVFLMIVGFGYSYFWSASTMIYLLMRRKVDDTDMDEVYLEEEDSEEPYSTPVPAPATPASSPASSNPVQMVEAPSLRPSTLTAPAAAAPVATESTALKPTDGNGSGTEGTGS